jgi:hypothetical protein
MPNNALLFENINQDSKANNVLNLLSSISVTVNYDDFLNMLFQCLDEYFEENEKNAEYFTSASEDAVTASIVSQLNATKLFQAEAQTYHRGAVDLTVRFKVHTWRAEAKIAYSNDKIFEGLLQLLTRYAVRDTHMGLLVYVQAGSFSNKFQSWKSFIGPKGGWSNYAKTKKQPENQRTISTLMRTLVLSDLNNNQFDCSFELDNGNNVSVRNYFVNQIFRPADVSGDTAKKHRTNRANNELKRVYFESREQEPVELDAEEVMMYLDMLYRDIDPDDAELVI